MTKTYSAIACFLIYVTAFGPLAASALAADTATTFIQDIKTLQAGIDSGKTKPADAIDTFSKSIVDHHIALKDVDAFVKTQMTATQFAAYQARMASALRGIDPSTLTAQETGQLVGQALEDIHTEGLYWDGCTSLWTGAAIAVAAIVIGVIAITKDKSTSTIQTDYQNKIAAEDQSTAANVQQTNNWQTAFPKQIATDQSDIGNQQNRISNDNGQINTYTLDEESANNTGDTNSANYYATQINNLNNDIASADGAIGADLAQIQDLQNRTVIYTNNPAQAAIDAQAFAANGKATDASLLAQENAAVAANPANEVMYRNMEIGAGIGAVVGGVLLYKGFASSESCI